MKNKTDGGPAFPATYWDHNLEGITAREQFPGMTLRDWFAGMALQGFCSMHQTDGTWAWAVKDAVEVAYEAADAMLAEREKTK